MSTLTVTNATLSDPADKTEVEANFSDIETWANGNIEGSNISNGSVGVAKLTEQYQDLALTLFADDLATASIQSHALVPAANDASWTVKSIEWATNDKGDSAGTFQLQYGVYSDAAPGVWSGSNMHSAVTVNSNSGDVTPAGATTLSTAQNLIQLEVTGASVGAQDLWVTVHLQRKVQE